MTDLASYQNRLSKNARHLARWARREGVYAWRIYDRDVPEFPVIVDWYATEDGARVHLQEVETGWQQSDGEHREWLDFVRDTTAQMLEVESDQICLKIRMRQRVRGDRTLQYERAATRGEDLVVQEAGRRFWINLSTYLDTGLFIDHRNTRRIASERVAGRRFLNLFAYTGSFSVYAATAGASRSTTVDLSNTYCDWAARNFALNGIDREAHTIVRADVLVWLEAALARGERFDVIVIDPPSFSNSKKMQGVLDVQRDHARLLRQCLGLIERGGEIYFSTNLRGFRLDETLAHEARIADISARTVPVDFRDRRVHQCWQLSRKGDDKIS